MTGQKFLSVGVWGLTSAYLSSEISKTFYEYVHQGSRSDKKNGGTVLTPQTLTVSPRTAGKTTHNFTTYYLSFAVWFLAARHISRTLRIRSQGSDPLRVFCSGSTKSNLHAKTVQILSCIYYGYLEDPAAGYDPCEFTLKPYVLGGLAHSQCVIMDMVPACGRWSIKKCANVPVKLRNHAAIPTNFRPPR